MAVYSRTMPRLIVVILAMIMILIVFSPATSHPSNASGNAVPQSSYSVNSGLNVSTPSTVHSLSTNSTRNVTYSGPGISEWSRTGHSLLGRLKNLTIPSSAVLPPNFNRAPVRDGNTYGPSYQQGPSPVGVASYGVLNRSGVLTPYNYSTPSFEGSLTVNNTTGVTLDSGSPRSYSVQLNAVLNNVTLFGKTGYQFWTQNVFMYSPTHHSLYFLDNIWNFSSPSAVIRGNNFHSYGGHDIPGELYYALGRTYNVTYPFTVHLYLNSTTIGNQNTVFFNYSLSDSSGITSGSYDEVQFNSSVGGNQHIPVPAMYKVSGNNLTNTGYIPMDAEIDIEGPGDGLSADFTGINATMNLAFLNGTRGYSPVRSAYSAGSETGETSTGVSVYYTGHTARLTTGPTITSGLWGLGQPGYISISGRIQQTSAFIFINRGTALNNTSAEWSPESPNGRFDFRVQPGTYSMEVMLNYYGPRYYNDLTSSVSRSMGTINMVHDTSKGLYTPVYASDNAQLANLSISGKGTASEPYLIPGPAYYSAKGTTVPSRLASPFGQVNDFMYPTFKGILVSGTTDHAVFDGFSSSSGAPAFKVQYPSSSIPILEGFYHETPGNYLQMVYYDSSHIIVNNSVISGWFSSSDYSFLSLYNVPDVASLMFWNTTSSLIEHNRIESQGSGAIIYGNATDGVNDTVWNNTFVNYPYISSGSFFGGAPIGLTVSSSGNTIYNNIFNTTIPVVSLEGPAGYVFESTNVTFHNRFNVTHGAASVVRVFDGVQMSGSILGQNTQGGNYYYNYFGDGSQPYNGTGVGFAFGEQGFRNGSINYGYDYAPLTMNNYSTGVFATGIPATQGTYFDVNNAIYPITPNGVTDIYLHNGSYSLLGFILSNRQVEYTPTTELYSQPLSGGGFVVDGPLESLYLSYNTSYNVTVNERGLVPGTTWGFSIPQAGTGYLTTAENQSLFVPAGVYTIYPQAVDNYYAQVFTDNVSGPQSVYLTYYPVSSSGKGNFTRSYSVNFTETGLPSGTQWDVKIEGHSYKSDASYLDIVGVPPGNYNFTAANAAGYSSASSGAFSINGGNASVSIVFSRNSTAAGYLEYAGIGAAGLIVGGTGVYLSMRRKRW